MAQLRSVQLLEVQEAASQELAHMHATLDDLEALGEIMTDMLKVQAEIEVIFFS